MRVCQNCTVAKDKSKTLYSVNPTLSKKRGNLTICLAFALCGVSNPTHLRFLGEDRFLAYNFDTPSSYILRHMDGREDAFHLKAV